jgi:hypothetical protein
MSDLSLSEPIRPHGPGWRAPARDLLLGAAWWAAFLLALEPGNLMRAAGAGVSLPLAGEALRILAASLLGAATAPVVLALVRRLPIEGPCWRGRAAIHAAGIAALVGAVIPLSCALAWISRASGGVGDTDVVVEFANNGLLVMFGLAGFSAVAHARHFRGRGPDRAVKAPAPAHLEQITVKARGGLVIVRMDEVDWIETQGNYQALHVGAATHLVREASTRLQARLDPARFVRTHRRLLVALDRVRAVTPLGGGDAEIRLADGTKLRLSRSFREAVQVRLEGGPSSS